MPRPTLETLHSDVIVEILHSPLSFGDLNALINSSPVLYNLFSVYSNSILTTVAQNIVGKDIWKEASVVLAYQRNCRFGNYIVKKDLEHNFVFDRKDIPQLLMNQRFFHSCSARFAIIVPHYYPRSGTQTSNIDAVLPWRPPPLSSSGCFVPSLTDGTLPIEIFYQAWVFALRFGFDSINTFASREPLSTQQYADFHLASHIMFLSCANEFCDILHTRYGPYETIRSWNLFNIWGYSSQLHTSEWPGKNPLLRAKLMSHLRTTAHLRNSTAHGSGYQALVESFAADYEVKSLKDLLEKYELSGEEVTFFRW